MAEGLRGWQAVKARILEWRPDRAQYLLSLKTLLINLELLRMPGVIGKTFSEAAVYRSDSNGLYLLLPAGPWLLPCYISATDLGGDLPLARSDRLGPSNRIPRNGRSSSGKHEEVGDQ